MLPAFRYARRMDGTQIFEELLNLSPPWRVEDVSLEIRQGPNGTVVVVVGLANTDPLACPECGTLCDRYDTRSRRWRHLDTMEFETLIVAEVPRVRCAEHGVHQIRVPWAEDRSRFTAKFEVCVIDWLLAASISAVARAFNLSWDQVAGIQARAVRRGLDRRSLQPPRGIGVDETAFQRRHEYVTVVNDLAGKVLYVADDRTRESLSGFYEALGEAGTGQIETVSMDMWAPYIRATQDHAPEADIVFDKFHVAKHLGDAVDKVRRQEHRTLMSQGDNRLLRTKYHWLRNPSTMSVAQWSSFKDLRTSQLKVARAWAIKEMAMSSWGYVKKGWAERAWLRWYSWAIRSRLEPIKRVARMIKRHWDGVMNAATSDVTNARAEGINSRIQWVKRMACGFRNRERFRNAIYFHLGGLSLYPESALNHTKS